MHIFFSGIGGAAIGPLALISRQAGYDVSGSDKQDSNYIEYLKKHGITDIIIGQSRESISELNNRKPIDWFIHTAFLDAGKAELSFCQDNGIKTSKRDELLNKIINDKRLKLIAIAGTHGKTTTTAMTIWLLKELELPVSYSVGAKISFGEMGRFDPQAEYFVYEADEYDRNFLHFRPYLSIIPGIDWDHPDIFPTRDEYNQAFRDFIGQSEQTYLWSDDAERIGLRPSGTASVLNKQDYRLVADKLPGKVNRENAALVMQAIHSLNPTRDINELSKIMNAFPGVSRRFEKIVDNVYSDYAHTPEKIRGALQLAHEVAGDNVVVVYEGLHNTRQHFIKDDLKHLFDSVKKLYIVPSYRAREDESLEDLTPEKLVAITAQPDKSVASKLDNELSKSIEDHAASGDLVLCLSAGGGGSLDEWLRRQFAA